MRLLAGMALVAVTVVGCAHERVFSPTSQRSAPGQVIYSVAPGGEVAIAVVGYGRVTRHAFDQTSFPALRVQMTLTNRGAHPWTVNPREQLAFIENYGPNVPAAVSEQPLVVAPGATRAIDLFYPVASPEFAQTPPRRLSLRWRVRLAGSVIGDRARLDHEVASINAPIL